MKIAITGHSKGIGKAIAEYFEQQGHTVIGFSRSNGFDITDELSRQRILDILGSCDVFINNAYAPQAQKQLLINARQLWEGTTNTIINVYSKSTLMKTVPAYIAEYVQDKSQQKELIKNRIFKARPHIINFTVGLVDTDMAKVFDAKKINPTNLAKFIYTLIEFKSTVAVQDVLVEVPDLDWDDIKKV